MEICHPHNLPPGKARPDTRRFGVRVTLLADNPFRRILGDNWERLHWFPSAAERDGALADMEREHQWSRRGDRPRLSFEPVER